jgi:hypothetical protein
MAASRPNPTIAYRLVPEAIGMSRICCSIILG